MVTEFLVVGGPRYHEQRILESFRTQEEAEARMFVLGMEAKDGDTVYGVWKANPQRIRKRASYELFRDMADFFRQEHSTQEIMEYIYCTIDSCKGWGSETNAWYAKESLFYLLKDLQQEDGVDCFVCKVQEKVQELDENQLEEIADLCLSELDRREKKVPSIKMEAEP
jgi:hypothetical protein